MATGHIEVTEGTAGKYIASNSITEDAKTKQVQRVVLNDSSGVELTANIGSLTETAPGTDTASSGLNGRLQRIAQRITDLLASVGVTTGAAVITDADGTVQQYLRGIVKLLITSGTVKLGASTAAIGKLEANSGVDIGDVDVTSMPTGASAAQVQGTVAAGSAAAQNPVQMGGKAVSAIPAVVDANDVANLLTDLFGRHLVAAEAPNEAITEGNTATITDTTVTEVLAAAGASTKWRITTIGVYNSDATVGTWVKIQDDTAGTPVVYWRGYAAAAGGGFNINFSPPLPAKGQANGKINVVCETTSAEVGCSVNAFKVPG